ncbi:MAG: hypothetical protein M3270_10370 [Thermoproteota archaeon]|nr:hypothetical protein [Thermoproteota archaeon]
MLMKQKLVNSMAAAASAHPKAATLGIGHPRLVTFLISLAISLAITTVIALAIGMFDSQQHHQYLAWAQGKTSSSSSGGGD